MGRAGSPESMVEGARSSPLIRRFEPADFNAVSSLEEELAHAPGPVTFDNLQSDHPALPRIGRGQAANRVSGDRIPELGHEEERGEEDRGLADKDP